MANNNPGADVEAVPRRSLFGRVPYVKFLALRWLCFVLFAAGALVVLVTYIAGGGSEGNRRKELYLNVAKVRQFMKTAASDDHTVSGLTYADAIDHKMEAYHDLLDDVASLLTYMAILCVLLALVMVMRAREIDVPFINQKLPLELFLSMVPLAGLMLWASFGFTMNTCIDARLNLVILLRGQAAEVQAASTPADGAISETVTMESNKIHYTITRASELEDRGLLDDWFWFFYPNDFLISTRAFWAGVIPFALILFYSLLLGCTHAAIPACLMYLHHHSTQRWVRWWTSFSALVAMFIVMGSHYNFYSVGRHANWMQVSILGFAAVVFWRITRPSMVERFAVRPPAPKSVTAQPEEVY